MPYNLNNHISLVNAWSLVRAMTSVETSVYQYQIAQKPEPLDSFQAHHWLYRACKVRRERRVGKSPSSLLADAGALKKKTDWCGEFTVNIPITTTPNIAHCHTWRLDRKNCFFFVRLTLLPPWINNYIHYNVRNEINNPIPNFNGCTVEVWEWISNFIPHFTVITYPCWDYS